jgi:hypothetical protein
MLGAGSRELRPMGVEAAAAGAAVPFHGLFLVGAFAAVVGWEPGVVVMLAGFVGLLGAHLAAGIAAYRRIMSRPWPRVPPLEDDDEW